MGLLHHERVSARQIAAQRLAGADAARGAKMKWGSPAGPLSSRLLATYFSRKDRVLLSFPHESVVAFARAP